MGKCSRGSGQGVPSSSCAWASGRGDPALKVGKTATKWADEEEGAGTDPGGEEQRQGPLEGLPGKPGRKQEILGGARAPFSFSDQ